MKNIKIIAFILLSVFFTIKTYSQGDLSFHVGPSFPMGDFGSGDMENDKAGGAAIGLNVGLKYVVPLSETGLGIFGGIDVNYNGLKMDVKEDFEDIYSSMGLGKPEVKYSKYINVPISAGLNYTYQVDDKIGVFANAGLAFNFLKITDMEVEYQGQTATSEIDLTNNIGFKIGGGILINPKTSVSIDYFGLGEHNVESVTRLGTETEELEGEIKVDLLTLTLGFKF